MQADAAALAAAQASSRPLRRRADPRRAAVRELLGRGRLQPQVGGTPASNVHMLDQLARRYYNQARRPTTRSTGPPCAATMIDVKLTETDLPGSSGIGERRAVHQRARAGVDPPGGHSSPARCRSASGRRTRSPRGPLRQRVEPARCSDRRASTKQRRPDQRALDLGQPGAPLPVPINTRTSACGSRSSGGTSTTCGDPLVECYDPGSANGLVARRAAGRRPERRAAQPAAWRAPSPLHRAPAPTRTSRPRRSTCTIGVQRRASTSARDPTRRGRKLTAVVGGDRLPADLQRRDRPLAVTRRRLSDRPGAGPLPIELNWEETIGHGRQRRPARTEREQVQRHFGTVQRSFGASDARSGPIKLAQVWENGSFWANSLQRCSRRPTARTTSS